MPTNQVTIKKADWSIDKESLRYIRRKVFIEEQNVPEELEWDESDDSSYHFLALSDDRPIACARLTSDGQIGRMAVLKQFRNQGIGSRLLETVLHQNESLKIKQLFLHAQVSALTFYEKHGFITVGETFHEAAIPHRKMLHCSEQTQN